jgi:hypothetical protein
MVVEFAVVLGDIADGPLDIGEEPEDVAAAIILGEHGVSTQAVEVGPRRHSLEQAAGAVAVGQL